MKDQHFAPAADPAAPFLSWVLHGGTSGLQTGYLQTVTNDGKEPRLRHFEGTRASGAVQQARRERTDAPPPAATGHSRSCTHAERSA